MVKFLIADGEPAISRVIKEYCEIEGYAAECVGDGNEAVRHARDVDYDMIVIDATLPKLDGFSAVREIRKIKNTPIIMLSARADEHDKLYGFELGIDDYVIKPFGPKELMARAAAIMRRCLRGEARLVSGELAVDFSECAVYLRDKRLSMTPKEYELFAVLARHNGKAFTRQELLDRIWGTDYYGDERTIDTHIKMLRKTLGENNRGKIVTVRSIGYKATL